MNINREFQHIMRLLSPSSLGYFLIQFSTQLRLYLFFVLLLAGIYPAFFWVLGQAIFPYQANGSLILDQKDQVRGSRLLSQNFSSSRFLHLRPSTHEYNAQYAQANDTNITQHHWLGRVKQDLLHYQSFQSGPTSSPIPFELITHSGSGLEPFIGVDSFKIQLSRLNEQMQKDKRGQQLAKPQEADFDQQQELCSSGGFWGPAVVNGMCINSWIAGYPSPKK